MIFDKFSRLGIVVGLISLGFAIFNVQSDVLSRATFLIVLVTSLIMVAHLSNRPSDEE